MRSKLAVLVALLVTLVLIIAVSPSFPQANSLLARPFPSVGPEIGLNKVDSGGAICAGESGMKVRDSAGNAYLLSNNHVLGENNGSGMEVDQPGLENATCDQYASSSGYTSGTSACAIGVVHSYLEIIPGYLYNEADAALSTANPATANAMIYGFTKTISTVVQTQPTVGEQVGFINSRSSVNGWSNLIVCTITSVNFFNVEDVSCGNNVSPCCFDIPNNPPDSDAGFHGQIEMYCPVPASKLPGDSGALVFSAYDQCNMPVGLLYSGDQEGSGSSDTLAPILLTLQSLGVSIAGTNTCQSNPSHGPVLAASTPRLEMAQLTSSEMSDKDHIYVHQGEPGYDPSLPSQTPTTGPGIGNYRPLTPSEEAQDRLIGQAINSPTFEATFEHWQTALGMQITGMGAMEMPDGSYKFVVNVDAGGKPIPDVLPHNFMGLSVVAQDRPPQKQF